MDAHGVELFEGPDGAEVCELTVARGVTIHGETPLVLGWLRDAGLEVLAVAVADARFSHLTMDCPSSLAYQWIHPENGAA